MRIRRLSTLFNTYRASGDEKRIRIILDNYQRFIPLVDAYEFGLIDTIKAERKYNRMEENGDLGVRVQTSCVSNPTATEGDEEEEIQRAVRNGDYITALRGADRFEEHKLEILTLVDMRTTYALVEKQVGSLNGDDVLFRRYLDHEFDLTTIAESEGVTIDAIKQRFRKTRSDVIENTLFCINLKKPYYYLEQKGA